MAFLVLAHIYAGEEVLVIKKQLGQGFSQLSFTHACSTQEYEGAYWLSGVLQPSTATPHRISHRGYGLVLPYYAFMNPILQL